MASEELVRQIADDLIQKLIKKNTSVSTLKKAYIVFCEETTDILRSKVIKALPNDEVIALGEVGEKITQISNSKAIILVAPPIDLAAKITALQTDNPLANLVIKALFADKRVICVATGALAATDSLRVGLRKAVEDLRCRLVEMGVEFTDLNELAQSLDTLAIEPQPLKDVTKINDENLSYKTSPNKLKLQEVLTPTLSAEGQKATSYPLPIIVYPSSSTNQPITHHPSQIKLASKDEISDFVDFLQTKDCTMEKGKPCDRCDMCNTLGF